MSRPEETDESWLYNLFYAGWCPKCGRDHRHHTAGLDVFHGRRAICELEPLLSADGTLVDNPEGYGVGLSDFEDGYISAARSHTCSGHKTGHWYAYELAELTLAAMRRDCTRFRHSAAWAAAYVPGNDVEGGRAFWRARNIPGGDWWRGWGEPHATALTKLCEEFGAFELVRLDTGEIGHV